MKETKPFIISRKVIWEAYQSVKANKGASGVDRVDLKEFAKDLKQNLYRIWNQMSSRSYMPSPVLLVEIPGGYLTNITNFINPVISGWINYYGKFQPSAMRTILNHINC